LLALPGGQDDRRAAPRDEAHLTTECGLIESLFTPEGIEWVDAAQKAGQPRRKRGRK
jgi:hypothetical protein